MSGYLCVIPARGGSKGIPRKNLRVVAGQPLIWWSIQAALAARCQPRVIVSTDDEEIAEVAEASGAEVPFLRPADLATDEAGTEPVLLHALATLDPDGDRYGAVILLQPTSPARAGDTIDRAVDQFERTGADSLLSVVEIHPFLWQVDEEAWGTPSYDPAARPRRQDLQPDERRFLETGSIYITATDALRRDGHRLAGRTTVLVTSPDEAVDIDAESDLSVVDALLQKDRERS